MKNFADRHIGLNQETIKELLQQMGLSTLDELIDGTIPGNIQRLQPLQLPQAVSENDFLLQLRDLEKKNKTFRSFIGLGYYGTICPSPIIRNIFQNPGWYTQYTPYQAEISQGRLEALLNFQTLVSDLTGLPVANASLLDEGTAAAEAMNMFYSIHKKEHRKAHANKFFIDDQVFPQTIEVLKTRARPQGIELVVGHWKQFNWSGDFFGALLQYPNMSGEVEDYSEFIKEGKKQGILVVVAADILSLTLLKPPAALGADAAIGNTQRFGIPLGYGGPHAAYFSTREEFKRQIPGRIIGVSVDRLGRPGYRMALQTREQHIRREKATSNICTAQALLAIMAGMYGVYHGPEGLKAIAEDIHSKTSHLYSALVKRGYSIANDYFFDTISIRVKTTEQKLIRQRAESNMINFGFDHETIRIALDETVNDQVLNQILDCFPEKPLDSNGQGPIEMIKDGFPPDLIRTSPFLSHPVFNHYHTETKLMRYAKRLENKDLSLTHSMIPLGSCTMKLNAATQLIPLSWDGFSNIHPFSPIDQVTGYLEIIDDLADYLCKITEFKACSFQPNSGAQGEFTGLMVIRAFHEDRGDGHRNIALIPSSAHGTNPASAIMAGMEVVVVACDERGNIDKNDLLIKASYYKRDLSVLIITYPSTHGVFEKDIKEVCRIIHEYGGLVYLDGANMNAQVGLTSPAAIGADVCHLNLHKTFAIPHGGGGPGMGPICVNEKLSPYLPGHIFDPRNIKSPLSAVASTPFGSASILIISYAYIRLLGVRGLVSASEIAILNANYLKHRLKDIFPVLYTDDNGHVAHELILDIRPFKYAGIDAEDVAKRLIDYSFHAPTVSFPVAGTLMIEPTESESLDELDRFCEAMIRIRKEIDEIANGEYPLDDNMLINAPHTAEMIASDNWKHPYSREQAVYPLPWLKTGFKFWPPISRIDNAYGDRHLVCTCPPIEAYQEANYIKST